MKQLACPAWDRVDGGIVSNRVESEESAMRIVRSVRVPFRFIVVFTLAAIPGCISTAAAQKVDTDIQDLTLHETTTSRSDTGVVKTMSSTNYFSRNAMRRTSPDGNDTIIRIDEGRIIMINREAKTYSSVTLQELNQMLEKTAAETARTDEQKEEVREMMGQAMDSFSVTKVGPGEAVAGYETEKYAVKGMMQMEIWAAPALKVPDGYYEALKMSVRPNPMFDVRRLYDEFRKINGMTMKTVATVKLMDMEIETETVVTSVDKKPIPASTFEVPEGYKQIPAAILK